MDLQNLSSVLSQQFLESVFKKLDDREQGYACLVCRAWSQTGKSVKLLQTIFQRFDAKSQACAAIVCKDWNLAVKKVNNKELHLFNKSLLSLEWGGYFRQFGQNYYMDLSNFKIDEIKSSGFSFQGKDEFGDFDVQGEVDIRKRRVKFDKNYENWGWLYKGDLTWDMQRKEYVINGHWGFKKQENDAVFQVDGVGQQDGIFQVDDFGEGGFKLLCPFKQEIV